MSVGHFADDDRLDDDADSPDEALRFHLDAGLLRAIRRRSWLGGSLAATELVGWVSSNSVIQSIAHWVSLPIAIAVGLDLLWALVLKCKDKLSDRVFVFDTRKRDQRKLRGSPIDFNQPRHRPDRRE